MLSPFSRFLDSSPRNVDGVLLLSPHRNYAHNEEAYDKQYNIASDDYNAGQGVHSLAITHGVPIETPVLELGCGTGRLSVGLLKSFSASQLILSDASNHFLTLLRDKLVRVDLPVPNLALLNFDDIHLLPDNAFGLILLRSALHHVEDYTSFIIMASRKLLPGGAICCEEPLHEGLFTLGLLARMIKTPLFDKSISSDIDLLARTMAFYCRHDVDKSQAEDKHAFRASSILTAANAAGLRLHFHPNKRFENFFVEKTSFCFSKFAQSYLKYCMNFNEKTVQYFMRHSEAALSYIDTVSGDDNAPESNGVFLLQRPF